MNWSTTKPTKSHERLAKTQISLRISAVWSESLLSAWRCLRSLSTFWAYSEGSDQTARLIWVFAGPTCVFVGFVMLRLNKLEQTVLSAAKKETESDKSAVCGTKLVVYKIPLIDRENHRSTNCGEIKRSNNKGWIWYIGTEVFIPTSCLPCYSQLTLL